MNFLRQHRNPNVHPHVTRFRDVYVGGVQKVQAGSIGGYVFPVEFFADVGRISVGDRATTVVKIHKGGSPDAIGAD
jgi:hypothetical protein